MLMIVRKIMAQMIFAVSVVVFEKPRSEMKTGMR